MKKIIIIVILASMASCKKANFYCYDTFTDAQGNISASTTGRVKKHFSSQSEMVKYQQEHNKACIEQH